MFMHIQYTVPDGELPAAMRYFTQGLEDDDPGRSAGLARSRLGEFAVIGGRNQPPPPSAFPLFEPQMADIFQEVDEEVRRDKAAEFWKKYQNLIIAGAALIVLAAGAFRYWQYEKEKAEQIAGDQFQAAISAYESGKLNEAYGGLAKVGADAPGGYRILAQMTEAGAKASSDAPAAIAAFDAIAGDASVDPLFRDAARLRAALLRVDQPNEEQAGAAALTSLAGGGGPFRRTARLTLGALDLSRGEYDEAAKEFDLVLGDPEASPTERQYAERWLGLIASNRTATK